MNFLKSTFASAKAELKHQGIRANGWATSKMTSSTHSLGIIGKIEDPVIGPLVDNLLQTEIMLKDLHIAVMSFSKTTANLCSTSADLSEVIMVTVGKTPEFGREALAYRAAVNALASPETPHSAIRALQYELKEVAEGIAEATKKLIASKQKVQERERRRVDLEALQKEVDFLKSPDTPVKYSAAKISELDAQIKLETGIYDQHNKIMTTELQKLSDKRFEIINVSYQKLKACQYNFFKHAAKAVTGEQPDLHDTALLSEASNAMSSDPPSKVVSA